MECLVTDGLPFYGRPYKMSFLRTMFSNNRILHSHRIGRKDIVTATIQRLLTACENRKVDADDG